MSQIFQSIIEKLSEEELADFKKGLEKMYLERPKKLSQEAYRYWSEILSGSYHFKRYSSFAEELRTLSKQELIEFHNRHVAKGAPHRRKISLAYLPALKESESLPEEDEKKGRSCKINYGLNTSQKNHASDSQRLYR